MATSGFATDGMADADIWPERLCFWLGCPAVLGLFAGWNAIGVVAPFLPLSWSLIYWLLLSFVMWAGLGVGTALVNRPLARLRVPHMVRIAGGALLGVALTRPAHAGFQHLFATLATPPPRLPPTLPASPRDWVNLYIANLLLMIFWAGGCAFFARFMRYVPFDRPRDPLHALSRQPSPPLPPVAGPLPRLTRLAPGSIDTCRAEDHYIRLCGPDGEELLLYRFADAAAELAAAGWVRVHRSALVRASGVAKVERQGRNMELLMRSGSRVAVSERYQGLAEGLRPS